MTRELAEAEVSEWLDKKRIIGTEREEKKASVEHLIGAVMEGLLVLDHDTWEFKQTLTWPFADLTELTYKLRVNDKDLEPYKKGLSASDGQGMFMAYVAAATGETRSVLAGMDANDKKIAVAIAIFFV